MQSLRSRFKAIGFQLLSATALSASFLFSAWMQAPVVLEEENNLFPTGKHGHIQVIKKMEERVFHPEFMSCWPFDQQC